jgi:hypothetical protein
MTVHRRGAAILICASWIACGQDEGSAGGVAEGEAATPALSSDCTGLVPQSLPASFSTDVLLGDECSSLGATSDGASSYVVGKSCGSGFDIWNIVDAAGAQRTGPYYRVIYDDRNERIERHFFAQPGGGFLALNWVTESNDGTEFHRVVSLRAYAGDGTQTGERFLIDLTAPGYNSFPDRSWSIAPVRSGGVQISHVSVPGDGTWRLYTQRSTAAGLAADGVQQLATSANLPSTPQHILTGVATGGQALVVWDNGTQGRAVWTDSRGHLLGGTFALPFRVDGDVSVAPLLDGTIAFRIGANWSFVLAPGSRTPAAAPSWLSTRPGSFLFLARGGRAHALVTQPPPGSCQTHVVLFAPAGNRCGAVDLPSADADGCASQAELGQDGTMTVRGRVQFYETDLAPGQKFSERFYPRLLQ